jgi:3-hydroxymyristoyl/3-hydroxydecanoyl-(acyl carrier protein) dehydratase
MLVDRILHIEGQKGGLGRGRIITEHDVLPDQWYLDGNRAPVCISVEAGQADLFLCAYLGIDLRVKGHRTYRLLDASVTFHSGLPRPGDTIRYDIRIERFIRQGDTWMFFFRFDGTINGVPLITMRHGCAGFFTESEVDQSGGIIITENEQAPISGKAPTNWRPPAPMAVEGFGDGQLEALRAGDLESAFGPLFRDITLPSPQRLPGGRMRLIHRVLDLDPSGGRYGIGRIRAEADIRPDDWFLVCHFVDDRVMPGTLMYECCAHTLRVFIQRMGWVSQKGDVRIEPMIGTQAVLKCRGPVTPKTRKVVYDIEISGIGFNPEPWVTADALIYADGHRIVQFSGMSMKLTGSSREDVDRLWLDRAAGSPRTVPQASAGPLFDRQHILEFATGRPSAAFGPPYRPFDEERFIARLPAPPYSFIDRVVSSDAKPWRLEPGGWITTEFDVDTDHWYFRANRARCMPLCVLMEIPLQACGFLAAYAGSALKSDKALHFRNLDGTATVHQNIYPAASTLSIRVRLTRASAAGGMIIENFDFEVLRQGDRIYTGQTNFGFFTADALAEQVGIRQAPDLGISENTGTDDTALPLADYPPLTPLDLRSRPDGDRHIPARALRMIDRIAFMDMNGGRDGLGAIRGIKTIDPDEWFFEAHFFQDPVCPGSLGVESLLQLARYMAGRRWGKSHPDHCVELVPGTTHSWQYRGQILPTNRRIVVDAAVADRTDGDVPAMRVNGVLKVDGLLIYNIRDLSIRLVPSSG